MQLPAIEMAADAVAELDFINAKAVFHRQFDCSIPEIDWPNSSLRSSATLDLVEARHPLLEENLRASGGAVVPVSFALDDEKNAMIISGANAGGKTVVLKTTGLLALMALSGISVPAKSARFPLYACSKSVKRPRWCCSMKSARERIRKKDPRSVLPSSIISDARAVRTLSRPRTTAG
jgi:dsDNA-specific endonuclease/ATPase MutS2